jgi:hypothetical protein
MTASDLVIDLKNLIGPGVEVDDSGLLTWVNESYLYICDEITKVLPDFFTKVVTTPTTADQQEYELPSDLDKVLMVNIAYDSSTWQRAFPMPNINVIPVHAREDNSGYSEGEPYFYLSGNYIGFEPIPSASGSINNIKLWYVYNPVELASADIPAIPTKYQHIIKYGAYANYMDQDDEHVAAERIRKQYDQRIYNMVEQLEIRQVDESKQVLVVQNKEMYEA